MKTEALIEELKERVDLMVEAYENALSVEGTVYAKEEYGLLQQAGLNEIVDLLGKLKEEIDTLREECTDIPNEKQACAAVIRAI